MLIALGLAVCFRSNVWNIGAEGPVRPRRDLRRRRRDAGRTDDSGALDRARRSCSPASLGGMVWAGIVALLRDRFNANEILVSLMLVYVAELLLQLPRLRAVEGSAGLQLPADDHLRRSRPRCRAWSRASRVNIGVLARAASLAAAFWLFLFRTYRGFQLQVGGLAPAAARYAGFSSRRALWTALLLSGGMAGLAGGARSGRAARPADAVRAGRLRLRRDHRRLRRPAASGRRRVRRRC